ncbi:MAG: hypothetical protein K0Q90_3285 [Paenibacillaceae bacterium]|jgi:hypothetical protein|nr:hypothetical protein [Paenibacillaceae bacterium]
MALNMIILQGDAKVEKEQGLFPIRWKSHHITELFIELCPKLCLDGSTKLSIEAARNRKKYGRTEDAGNPGKPKKKQRSLLRCSK